MYLHKDRDAFRDLIEQVSGKTGRTPMVVEKDYYVTLVLQLLSEQLSNCVFKGGTSLSKGFRVIDRFSEDIDITFDEHIGENRRKKLKNVVLKGISEILGMPIVNWEETQSDRDYNAYHFLYTSVFGLEDERLPQFVKLETALGSYSFPTQVLEIGNYIGDYLIEMGRTDLAEKFRLAKFTMKFECPRGTAIIVRNHESIRGISRIVLSEADGERYMSATRDIIIVEGCSNFMSVYVGDVCKLVSVTDVPQGVVVIDPNNLQPKYVFDGNIYVERFLDDSHEGEVSRFLDAADITWVNVKKTSVGYKREDVEPLLLGALVDLFSCEVSEKKEDVYDENGVKGYDIYVDTKEAVYETYSFKFSLYCNQKPEADALKTRVSKVLDFVPLAYSPNRGVYADALLSFEVVYESDEGEQSVGTIHKRRYCFIEPDGTVSFYSTAEEWDIPDYEKLSYEIENSCYLDLEDYAEGYKETETN